ncbi:MAG TPA: Rrf2 family transcriptional regulator [Verrucomicrobiota bacterium]|nr:Rrf2 family transcriptional regulator [Verrucomicrobiota bacterium]HNU50634.1 Rrf2 family transcriptional regulator [Verrucomicrobiota bacterium]
MQITRAGEYGVLGLLNLARREPGEVVMIDALSRDEGIPRSFLAKVFQQLARAGLVRSLRGVGGGFVLARQPDQITVLEVLEAIEGRLALQRCTLDMAACRDTAGCRLCGLLGRAQDRMRDVLGQTTLAELAGVEHRKEAV